MSFHSGKYVMFEASSTTYIEDPMTNESVQISQGIKKNLQTGTKGYFAAKRQGKN